MTQIEKTLPVTFSGIKALREFMSNYEGSWRKLAWEFNGQVSISTLRRIIDGDYIPKRPETIRALHLPLTAPVPVCPRHGVAHKGRCPKRTFEENAAEYDCWRAANAGRIKAILEWDER